MAGGIGSIPGWGTKILHAIQHDQKQIFKKRENFPGGSVVKNRPTNAGDTGLIPDLGRSHRATDPVPITTESEHSRALQREAHTPQLESSPCLPQLEKSRCSNKDPAPPKINNKLKLNLKKQRRHTHIHTGRQPHDNRQKPKRWSCKARTAKEEPPDAGGDAEGSTHRASEGAGPCLLGLRLLASRTVRG